MLYRIEHISDLGDYSASHVDVFTHCESGRALGHRIITEQCLCEPTITLVEVLFIAANLIKNQLC